ncbi:PilX N-terminal domain-containing pilus assembly protein [Planctomycetota bacterium]
MQFKNRKAVGIVLIVVLGVLALLSVLAITFVSMTRLEKAIAANYVDRTRAILAAESGVDHAIARLRAMPGGVLSFQDTEALKYNPDNPNLPLDQASQPSFLARVDVGTDGSLDPVSGVVGSSHTANGDYFKLKVQDCSSKLNLNDNNGKYNIDTDPLYDDPNNDPEMDFASGRLYKIIEYLGERLFGDIASFPDGGGIGSSVASAIINARANDLPDGRFTTHTQLQEILVKTSANDIDHPLTLAQYLEFLNYVTLWSWQDSNVIRPTYKLDITVHPDQEADIPQNDWDDSWDIYLFFDAQTKGYELEPRCPVNVNTAPVELLEALIAPIQGWYLYEGPAEKHMSAHFYGPYIASTSSYTYEDRDTNQIFENYGVLTSRKGRGTIYGANRLSDAIGDALGLAQAIHEKTIGKDINGDGFPAAGAEPDPFGSWQEFEDFLHEPLLRIFIEPTRGYESLMDPDDPNLPSEGPWWTNSFNDTFMDSADTDWWCDYFHEIYIDLILANFNPNSRFNDYNPDRHIFQHVDKAQLTQYSTEFCFEPTGAFEIASLGIIQGNGGKVQARSEVYTVVELWKIFRHSTQAQFMAGLDNDAANMEEFFSTNEVGLFSTAGYKATSTGTGFTLQSYPEPLVDDDSYFIPPYETDRNYIDESKYDGYLSLASHRIREGDFLANMPARFVCNFEGTLKPETFGEAGGSDISSHYLAMATDDMVVNYQEDFSFEKSVYYPPMGFFGWTLLRSYRLNTNQPTAARLTNPVTEPHVPGVLHPDGALSDAGRTLAYRMANIGRQQGQIGTLEFWLKPNYDPAITTRMRSLLEMTPQMHNYVTNWQWEGLCYMDYWNQDGWMVFLPHDNNLNKSNPQFESDIPLDELYCAFFEGTSPLYENPFPQVTAPRSVAFGWWCNGQLDGKGNSQFFGRSSSTMNHSWPGHDEVVNHGIHDLFNFEAHEWTHILVSWDRLGHSWGDKSEEPSEESLPEWRYIITLRINDQDIHDLGAWDHFGHATNAYPLPPTCSQDKWQGYSDQWYPNSFRFGEFASKYEQVVDFGIAPQDAPRNWACDATIADIVAYADGPYQYELWKNSGIVEDSDFPRNYQYGRYYSAVDVNNTAGQYWSTPVNLHKEFSIVDSSMRLLPRSVSWTLYWPDRNRDCANADNYIDLEAPDINGDGVNDPISVDFAICENGNDEWYYDYEGNKILMATNANGTDFRLHNPNTNIALFQYRRQDDFRYTIQFNLAADQFLYQSPVLDDITFTFHLSRPRVMLWRVS